MPVAAETVQRLTAIPNLIVSQNEPLSQHTRFGIGGPAAVLAEAADEDAFAEAVRLVRQQCTPLGVIGGGTNLVVSDAGFDGVVLRFRARRIDASGTVVTAGAGATLEDLIERTIQQGLRGLETMAGIPGTVGAAVYGNAGAYGRSISESIRSVRYWDGEKACSLPADECRFEYRSSIFKRNKDWIVFQATLALESASSDELRRTAEEILDIRNRKYPPTLQCAGSIFKNLLLRNLSPEVSAVVPDDVVREGKVPSAWFLEQVGAKGIDRGDIHVADYHANLIFNGGSGTAADLRALIDDLKARVREKFGLELEEEVQYLGW
jgi:UDP-N-acetylmuramate dehydrogenase